MAASIYGGIDIVIEVPPHQYQATIAQWVRAPDAW
jgi:hypothetical protein